MKLAFKRLGMIAGAGVLLKFLAHSLAATPALAPAGLPSPGDQLTALHLKFNGASSCSNAQCHGDSKEKPNGESFSNEWTLWATEINQQADPHHSKTWAALKNAQGQKIAQGLGIANATQEKRCLSCHALNVPAALQGKNYRLNEGVTCEACHGPSEKWLDPHSKKGWYAQEKQKVSFETLLTTEGLYDTRPVHARAVRCTSCHLAIEPDLVAKGHPQPSFELNYFSESYPNRHWHEPDGYFKAKLWAGGQQVALQEALKQLAQRAATGTGIQDADYQAMAHYSMFAQFLAVALPGDAKTLSDAIAQVQKAYTAKTGLAAAANAAAAADDQLTAKVEAFEPNKQTTLKMLTGVAGLDKFAIDYGRFGQDQQSYAIFALYSAYASAEKPADANDVTGLIGDKLFADPPPAAQQYVQNLAAVKAKLPH